MLLSSPFLRSLTRWLVAAMLLATLAPAISRTLAATHGVGDWVEICSGTSMRWVQMGASVDEDEATDSKHLSLLLDECGHCLLTADRFAPLIPTLPVFIAAATSSPAPLHRGDPATSVSAPSPVARGPPFLF
jgi:hypothetical protein